MDLCLWILNRKKTAIEIWILHVVRDSVWKHGADTQTQACMRLAVFSVYSVNWEKLQSYHIHIEMAKYELVTEIYYYCTVKYTS